MSPRRLVRAFRPLVPLLLLVVLGSVICGRFVFLLDISYDGRNSLREESREILALLKGPLEVSAIVPEGSPAIPGIRKALAPYQRVRADMALRFLDPRRQPEEVQTLGGRLGEIVIRQGKQIQQIAALDEVTVTKALARLARQENQFVAFLSSNGERRIDREANHDLSLFAEHLSERGLKVISLSLGSHDALPDNASALVIASPSVPYNDKELGIVQQYLKRGGNLLWLTEPESAAQFSALATALSVRVLPGTIVDPVGLTKYNNPAFAVAAAAGSATSIGAVSQPVVFPYAAALRLNLDAARGGSDIARTTASAWTETGAYSGNVAFDAPDEVQGPLSLAVAQSRSVNGRMQRVVVVGDGDFLSNMFIENLGNLEFGRRAVDWLLREDALLDFSMATVPDARLDLEIWQRMLLFLTLVVLLPALLVANGILHWWRRRHA